MAEPSTGIAQCSSERSTLCASADYTLLSVCCAMLGHALPLILACTRRVGRLAVHRAPFQQPGRHPSHTSCCCPLHNSQSLSTDAAYLDTDCIKIIFFLKRDLCARWTLVMHSACSLEAARVGTATRARQARSTLTQRVCPTSGHTVQRMRRQPAGSRGVRGRGAVRRVERGRLY